MQYRRSSFMSTPLLYCPGPIPDALGGLTNLRHLSLHGNQLTGAPIVSLNKGSVGGLLARKF